jgi:hypothetical protein
MSPLPSPVASPISPSSSSIGSWVRQEEAAMMERQIRIGNGLPSSSSGHTSSAPSSFYWGTQDTTDVDNFPNRDDYATDSIHSSARLPPSDIPFPSPPRAQPRRTPTPSTRRGSSRPSSRNSSSRATSLAPSDSVSTTGPVRRRRGSIVPEDDLLETYPPINTNTRGFRFGGKTYLLTYSQIGDIPNSALEDKFNGFGNQVKSK